METTQRIKENEETEEYFSNKSKRTQSTHLNEMEISDLPDKEFKIMVIKMLTKLRRIIYEQ